MREGVRVCVGGMTYFLHGFVGLKSYVRYPRIQHQREQIENQVSRPDVYTWLYSHGYRCIYI